MFIFLAEKPQTLLSDQVRVYLSGSLNAEVNPFKIGCVRYVIIRLSPTFKSALAPMPEVSEKVSGNALSSSADIETRPR